MLMASPSMPARTSTGDGASTASLAPPRRLDANRLDGMHDADSNTVSTRGAAVATDESKPPEDSWIMSERNSRGLGETSQGRTEGCEWTQCSMAYRPVPTHGQPSNVPPVVKLRAPQYASMPSWNTCGGRSVAT